MRVLIVGYGRMGHFHHKTLIAAGDTPVTLDPYTRAATYKKWPARLRNIDAAIIATPIDTLHEQTLEAIDRNIDRILIEKPAAATPVQVADLWAAQPTLTVGYLERGNPAANAFLDAVPPNAHVTYTRYGPRTTTNLGLDVASHDLDLHLMHTQTQPHGTTRHTKRGITLELDTATIHAGHSPWPIRTLEAAGYKADLITRTLHLPNGNAWTFGLDDLLANQWQQFKQDEPLATIHDALLVIDTLDHTGAIDQPAARAA